MSLCYDFQKSMIVSLSLSTATLIIGLKEDKKILYKAIITASVVIGLLLINSANAITAENLEILKQRCLEYDFTHKPLTTSEAQDHFMNTICHPAGGEITAESYENAIKTLYMEELKKAFNR